MSSKPNNRNNRNTRRRNNRNRFPAVVEMGPEPITVATAGGGGAQPAVVEMGEPVVNRSGVAELMAVFQRMRVKDWAEIEKILKHNTSTNIRLEIISRTKRLKSPNNIYIDMYAMSYPESINNMSQLLKYYFVFNNSRIPYEPNEFSEFFMISYSLNNFYPTYRSEIPPSMYTSVFTDFISDIERINVNKYLERIPEKQEYSAATGTTYRYKNYTNPIINTIGEELQAEIFAIYNRHLPRINAYLVREGYSPIE